MAIPQEDIQTVRARTDIVQLISEQTTLKRVGRRWVGLCPFHAERTPSFSVNADDGLYYCFGCKKHGDAIRFVMDTQHLDFPEAVEVLGERAGVKITRDAGDEEHRTRRNDVLAAMERAAAWYHERLMSSDDAGAARSYLRSRGMSRDEVTDLRVGWAPDSRSELAEFLSDVPLDVLRDAGLAHTSSDGGRRDFFRGRVMFPISDHRGRVVGFGGRTMQPVTDRNPKYKNTPETSVYSKRRVLYGLHLAADAARESGEIVVCEGYMDVVGFRVAGVANAVATCGTALTEDHLGILRRHARRVVLAYDADAAGQAAVDRLYDWERAFEVDFYVMSVPSGKDPADAALDDPAGLQAAVAEAKPILAHRVERIIRSGDTSTPEGRARVATEVGDAIGSHPDEIVRSGYVKEVAEQLGVPAGAVGGRVRPTAASTARAFDPLRSGKASTSEIELLSFAVHDPEVFASSLGLLGMQPDEVERLFGLLFPHAEVKAAFDALLAAPDLATAIDSSDEEVADLLVRLSVDEPASETPTGVLVGILRNKWGALVHANARRMAEEHGVYPDTAAFKAALDRLEDQDTADEAVREIVRWALGDGRDLVSVAGPVPVAAAAAPSGRMPAAEFGTGDPEIDQVVSEVLWDDDNPPF